MLEQLQGKKIALLGLGTNNGKLAEFFKQQGISFAVLEWENPSELEGKLNSYDVVFRTPGLPYLTPALQVAKASGVTLSSQTKLFFEICPCPIIGVTGTKGKGTTSTLIAKILESAGKKVWLGGNIGTDPFEFVNQIKSEDLVVLELSSFQLQDMEQSPHIAVVLSITPDHLNHHKDFEEYITAKSNIINFQKPTDFAILHPNLPDWFRNLGKSKKIFIDPSSVTLYERKLLGNHNLENISAALEVAKLLGISEEIAKETVKNYQPLPHRLQIVAEKKGITFVDDSISTNEESTIAAIASFPNPVIVILGGSTKGLDYVTLGQYLKSISKVKAIIVVGEVTPILLNAINGFPGEIFTGAKTMSEIFSQIKSIATAGDVVLLSPAAASFDMFKDYKDRAEQFIQAVNAYE